MSLPSLPSPRDGAATALRARRRSEPDALGADQPGEGSTRAAGAQLAQQAFTVREQVGEKTASRAHQVVDVRRTERVEDGRPFPRGDDDSRAAKHGELLGEVRGLDLDLGQQLVDGTRASLKQLEDANPNRVPEGAEELGFRLVQLDRHSGAGRVGSHARHNT